MRSKVDLPEPLLPSRATNWPAGISRSSASNTGLPPNDLLNCVMRTGRAPGLSRASAISASQTTDARRKRAGPDSGSTYRCSGPKAHRR
ncbi:hypothetical protein G6F65_020864 [Rhizopus arrhizus]|nr:hypothetical protein G6F65_020864 [Rhizopus arrhizus]